jgi:hypothetical protein
MAAGYRGPTLKVFTALYWLNDAAGRARELRDAIIDELR